MSIEQELQLPAVSAYIELFKVDLSIIFGSSYILYFTPNTNGTDNIVFGGNTYLPWPMQISGFGQSNSGAPPRPILTFGNLDSSKTLTQLVFCYGDLVGGFVTYFRTFAKYLNLSSEIAISPITFTIGRKTLHNNKAIQFELRTALDKERQYLPNRQMLKTDFPGLGVNQGVYSSSKGGYY